MPVDISTLVSKLNDHSNQRYTRVRLEELSLDDLTSLVLDVLHKVAPEYIEETRTYPSSQYIEKILKLLSRLEYNDTDTHTLEQELTKGSREAFYRLMSWTLDNIQPLKEKLYLSRFLSVPEVAPEFSMFDDVNRAKKMLLELQTHFNEVYSELSSLRTQYSVVSTLSSENERLESETRRLAEAVSLKTSKLNKIAKDLNLEATMKLAAKVRNEEMENIKLRQSVNDQSIKLSSISDHHSRLGEALKSVELMNSDNAGEVLQREILQLQEQISTVLPAKVSGIRDQIEVYSLANSTDETELRNRVEELKEQEHELQRLIAKYTAEKNSRSANDPVSLFRTRAETMEKARKKAIDKVEKEKLKQRELTHELETLHDLHGPTVTKEQYKALAGELNQLKTRYQSTKQQLLERRVELESIDSSITALKEAYPHVDFSDFSVENQEEGDDLLDDDVDNLNIQIATQKKQLQPLVKAYKQLKAEYAKISEQYTAAKNVFDEATGGILEETQQLGHTVATYQQQCNSLETQYYLFNEKLKLLKIQADRAKEEAEFRKGSDRFSAEHASYKAMYEAVIKGQREVYKELVEKKKYIDDNKETGTQQVVYFKNLYELLQAKLAGNEDQEPINDTVGPSMLEVDTLDLSAFR
ncbi:hypothetical protein RCL1_002664 [Eukaryota sp. TZLM3-RCL]